MICNGCGTKTWPTIVGLNDFQFMKAQTLKNSFALRIGSPSRSPLKPRRKVCNLRLPSRPVPDQLERQQSSDRGGMACDIKRPLTKFAPSSCTVTLPQYLDKSTMLPFRCHMVNTRRVFVDERERQYGHCRAELDFLPLSQFRNVRQLLNSRELNSKRQIRAGDLVGTPCHSSTSFFHLPVQSNSYGDW